MLGFLIHFGVPEENFTSNSPKRGRLLVVDDERVIADTLTLILAKEGYDTRTAYSGEEAVRIAATFRPELLISDIKMPGMSGIDAACIIVESQPECSVLLVSGHLYSTAADDGRLGQRGFEIMNKPVAPDRLLAKVAAIMAARPSRTLTIVNVDDAEIARYAVTHILKHAGFQVKEAGTGAEALKLAMTKPDLILLDIHLPDMTGFEVCRRLRALPETASIPIVHLTNTCRDEESRQLALRLGANGYLTQPVEPEPLVCLLRDLAEHGANTSPN